MPESQKRKKTMTYDCESLSLKSNYILNKIKFSDNKKIICIVYIIQKQTGYNRKLAYE